jgi:hypothetical protein
MQILTSVFLNNNNDNNKLTSWRSSEIINFTALNFCKSRVDNFLKFLYTAIFKVLKLKVQD